MNRTTGRIIAIAVIVTSFVIGQVMDSAAVFGLGAVSVKILSIVSGVLTLVANYLPNAWKGDPPTL